MSMFKSCGTFLVSFALLLTSLLVMYYASQLLHKGSIAKLIFPFLGYANPLIVAMAVSLFLMVKSLPAHVYNFLNKFLSANIFIYLLTEVGVFVSYKQLASEFGQSLGFALIHSFIVIVLCLLAGQVLMFATALLVEKSEKIFKFK